MLDMIYQFAELTSATDGSPFCFLLPSRRRQWMFKHVRKLKKKRHWSLYWIQSVRQKMFARKQYKTALARTTCMVPSGVAASWTARRAARATAGQHLLVHVVHVQWEHPRGQSDRLCNTNTIGIFHYCRLLLASWTNDGISFSCWG